MKINKISLNDFKSENVSVNLSAEIKENGDLCLEGQDLGTAVEEHFGDGDYEYLIKVAADYKDSVLLYLIKERFKTSSEFREWLAEKNVPNEFWSF